MDPVRTCALCPKLCRYACPPASATGDENATPTGMATLAVLIRAGSVRSDPGVCHVLYRCTGCLGCQVPCDFDIDVAAWLRPLRAAAWASGNAPACVIDVADRVAAGGPPDERSAHHADLDGPRFDGDGTVYWPGCALAGEQPDAVERNRLLLEHVLEEPVSLPPRNAPACCGEPMAAAGDRSRYLAHRASLTDALRGATRVVTTCACCLDSLPEGAVHLVSLLGFSWSEKGNCAPVAYHDPCRQARPVDLGGAPRAILAAATGSPVIEFVDRGGETGCCGAGDAFGLFFPDDGRAVAEYRLRDPAVNEAGTVVTACSRCTAHLSASAPAGVDVVDLGEFLHGCLGSGTG